MADPRIRPCANCGKAFALTSTKRGAKPRHCGSLCKLQFQRRLAKARWDAGIRTPSQLLQRGKKHSDPTPCQQCGAPTTRPKYCSEPCGQKAHVRRNGVRPWAERYPDAVVRIGGKCVVCGSAFSRRIRSAKDVGHCCSRDCGFALIRLRAAAKRPLAEDVAMYRRWGAAERSRMARLDRRSLQRLKEARQALCRSIARYVLNPKRPCKDCGAEVGGFHGAMIFCGPCSKRRHRLSPSYRASKAQRRAIERGRSEGAERFDPIEILRRDGWRCHICGINTPRRLRGSYNDRAPELDHIIPLSKGGNHSRLNTACCCRKCNIMKSDKIIGQLRLVA